MEYLTNNPAILALADGQVFKGTSLGFPGSTVGEIVFNTAMTGYQEILTDPSYAQQLITLSYPHIGNVGCNLQDMESNKIWAAGLIVRDSSSISSNWRSQQTLREFLIEHQLVAIGDIDTRYLTQIIRDKGAQAACVTTDVAHPEQAIKQAQAFPGLKGKDLAIAVTTPEIYEWRQGSEQWKLTSAKAAYNFHVIAYDYGVKSNILKILVDKGCRVTVVPATTPVATVLKYQPDGIFLSNGPGDPAACDYAIEYIKQYLELNIPIFGICLGFQLLALACGAKSSKMKIGHHGANHPVMELSSKQVAITSQNHGFTIDEASLPESLIVTHRSSFDNSLQGIRHRYKPAFAVQGHPEASPGPHDHYPLFDNFINLIAQHRA